MITKNCNCICDYCFNQHSSHTMSVSMLQNVIKEIMSFCYSPYFLWYGGEPMLNGLNYFKKIIQIQTSYNNNYNNLIQTNLTIKNYELLEYLVTNNFTISTSIDGDECYYNKKRRYKTGNFAFRTLMSNIDLLKSMNARIWVICVISNINVENPLYLFNFFSEHKLNIRFCPEISNNENSITSAQYLNFIKNFYELWNNNNKPIRVSNFEKAKKTIENKYPQECDNLLNCIDNNLCINYNGDIYPCNRCIDIDLFKLGNIDEGFINILSKDIKKKYSYRGLINDCKCTYFNLLNAGCFYNAYIQSDNWQNKDKFCNVNKYLLNLVQYE